MKDFKEAISSIPELRGAYKKGLGALKGGGKAKIKCRVPRKLEGSVDIDVAMKELCPEAHRWDYLVSYQRRLHFIEIHSADGDKTFSLVLKKLEWLKGRLKNDWSEPFKDFPKHYHWIATGSIDILKGSSSARKLAEVALRPTEQLDLDNLK